MGVTGLWKVVEHCARPTKIETLNRKRLAVDASIWIYQFLKAVRDKEGNALRNSHVVGFFRRICKLLFIGILPVFVFDGGAPVLKRQTIVARKSRREVRREDAAHTASKLLAREMQRLAEEETQKRRDAAAHTRHHGLDNDAEEDVPDNPVYADELNMTEQQVQQARKFRKTDQYHLPDLHTSMAEMGAPDDPRVMSLPELEAYARQFDTGEDLNVYDFSKIDFDGPFFVSLPASDRYNILNAARLRSRLRMGHSKEQLDAMFPDRMAFSRFQIERVTERNELTQRLMNINGMNGDDTYGPHTSERVAGEKGREYILVKNDGVEGGWALGVVTNKDEGKKNKPIDVDLHKRFDASSEDEIADDGDDEFEDVPIEGLNRLPKSMPAETSPAYNRRAKRRRHPTNKSGTSRKTRSRPTVHDGNSLFVQPEHDDQPASDDDDRSSLFGSDDDQEQLDQAIALSLQQHTDDAPIADVDDPVERFAHLNNFQQQRADEARPLPKGSGKAVAHIVNLRAAKSAPKPSIVGEDQAASDGDDDDNNTETDLRQALENSNQLRSSVARVNSKSSNPPSKPVQPRQSTITAGFSGPLPFEKLNLGSSLLGKKKMQDFQERTEGGFEKANDKKKDDAKPLPPWFADDLDESLKAQRRIEQSDRDQAREFAFTQREKSGQPSALRRSDTELIVDLDSPEKPEPKVLIIQDDPIAPQSPMTHQEHLADSGEPEIETQNNQAHIGQTMGDMADVIRAMPPKEQAPQLDDRPLIVAGDRAGPASPLTNEPTIISVNDNGATVEQSSGQDVNGSDDPVEWSDSDKEPETDRVMPAVDLLDESRDRSESPQFEDVAISSAPSASAALDAPTQPTDTNSARSPVQIAEHASGQVDQHHIISDDDAENYGYYTDSEDERLMQDLAVEVEEHARFASELNHRPQQQQQMQQEYEKEMKQLRSQQKKDRRDADEVTQIMITECQQLLRMFGLPYITAPMEAEAQCAELVRLGLVDGIVTDDSDCFLFGGTRIYKNMFNQAKVVECYLAPDLEKEYDLSRQKLIDIAQLLGSDYTEGLAGIGHVKALEILSEFATLAEFKEWWTQVQANQYSKTNEAETSAFRTKFRRAHINKLFLPPGFPDPRVEAAYMVPEVDSDPSQFQWGVPDLVALRSFLSSTVGWSADRTDEVLVPVIRDMNRRAETGTQSNITAFMRGGAGAGGVGGYAPKQRLEAGSKRAGTALDRMAKKAKSKRK